MDLFYSNVLSWALGKLGLPIYFLGNYYSLLYDLWGY